MNRSKIRRCRYVAFKYWRMNPWRLWWIGHVIDEWRRDDHER